MKTRAEINAYQAEYRLLMREREKRAKSLKAAPTATFKPETKRVEPKFCDRCHRQLGSIVYISRNPTRQYHRECYS